jgi:hypothetical protein
MTTVHISLGAALEAAEGNIMRFSAEVVRQLISRMGDRWDAARLSIVPTCDADGLFLTVSDGRAAFRVKVELAAFSTQLSVAVH